MGPRNETRPKNGLSENRHTVLRGIEPRWFVARDSKVTIDRVPLPSQGPDQSTNDDARCIVALLQEEVWGYRAAQSVSEMGQGTNPLTPM